jgi:hypothetical protein
MTTVTKETKVQEIYVQIENKCGTRNVVYCRSHRNSDKRFKEKFGSQTGKAFDRFTTKDSCIWNVTHNTESAAV